MPLTAEQCEVIRIAEQFILENGYTKAPPTSDRSRITWALGDDPRHPEFVLKIRHDTLKPHAYGLRSGAPGDPLAWAVVFEYSDRLVAQTRSVEGKPREPKDATVVRVRLGSPAPHVVKQHTPVLLDSGTRLPPPEEVSAMCAGTRKAQ